MGHHVYNGGGGGKHKISAVLEEKSIFSTENEINFIKILSKDTTVDGYESRINVVEARKTQINEEIKKILEDFANSYPPLEPQKPDETLDDFNKRRDAWTKEGMHQVAEFQRKHKNYEQKLERSIDVLNDYITATQSTVMTEPSFGAKVELGSYDAEKEQFELLAQDTASEKSPFLFKGWVGVPRDTAKGMNRAAPGFLTTLQFINFPFKTDSASVNLAMSKLSLSRNGHDFKVEGFFGQIDKYRFEAGYEAWKVRADSLLSGKLKPQGLDYVYAMGKKPVIPEDEEKGDGPGWRFWTRVVAFTATAVFGGFAISKHLDAQEKKRDLKKLKENIPHIENPDIKTWHANWDKTDKSRKDSESQRNLYGGIADAFALGGVVTFFF